jgi:hypothetical protein
MFRVHAGAVDYAILAVYFVVVLGIGFAARRQVHSGLDFFLSGRSLPAWITGLAFIAANLGALEILGLAANGAKYGVATVHFYWIGAVPAMVFLGIVMMPFYYNATSPLAGCLRPSTTRCCSSSSSWPAWCRSPSSGSRRSAAGAGSRTR